ncbi:MAG: hypothetical protein WC331_08865 [Candidatus Omnitrophota bacterium]
MAIAFFVCVIVPFPFPCALASELILNETGRSTPTLTLEQANAQSAVVSSEIPSGAAIQNTNPLSLPTPEQSVPLSSLVPGVASDSITRLDNGLYEVKLGAEFKALRNNIMTPALVAGCPAEILATVELSITDAYVKEKLADVYDFVVFLPTTQALHSTSLLPYINQAGIDYLGLGWGVDSNIQGIGLHQENRPGYDTYLKRFLPKVEQYFSETYEDFIVNGEREGGVLLDVAAINSEYSGMTATAKNNLLDNVLLEEFHHRWGSFLGSRGSYTLDSLGILGRDNGHWSAFFDAGQSPMDGIDWTDLGNGSFELERLYGMTLSELRSYLFSQIAPAFSSATRYNDFDLYAMGLLSKDQVQPGFVISSPTLNGKSLTEANWLTTYLTDLYYRYYPSPVRGTRREITIYQVLAKEGIRTPSSADSEKVFNAAFVIVTDASAAAGSSNYAELNTAVQHFKSALSSVWSTATRSLSTMTMGTSAQAVTDFGQRLINAFSMAEHIDSEDLASLETEFSRLEALQPAVTQLKALVSEVKAILGRCAGFAASGLAKSSVLGLAADLVKELEPLFATVTAVYNELFPGSQSSLAAAQTAYDAYTTGLAGIQSLVSQLDTVTAILPAGFTSNLDKWFGDASNAGVLGLLNTLSRLTSTNNLLPEDNSYEQEVRDILAKLQKAVVAAKTFDSGILSANPFFAQMRFSGSGSPSGTTRLLSNTASGYSYSYNVNNSTTAQSKHEVTYEEPVSLSETYNLALQGPSGVAVQIVLTDAAGGQADFFLLLTGVLSNYTLDLTDPRLVGFDRSQIVKVEFNIDAKLALKARSGTLTIKTPSGSYGSSIGGFRTVLQKTTMDSRGYLIGFEENVYDAVGNFLYKLVRFGVVRNLAGTVTGYRETVTIPVKGTLYGTFTNGTYRLTGTIKENGISQAVNRSITVDADTRLFLEDGRTEVLTGDGFLVMGLGEASAYGDFTAVRYKETKDTRGRVTGFEEHIYDATGNFLYKLVRSGVVRNLAGTVTGYREIITSPAKGTLSGTFANGVYRLTGTIKKNGVSQAVNRSITVDADTRLFLEDGRTEVLNGDGFLVMGLGEASAYGDFNAVRYKETKDTRGRVTGFEEHIYDATGNFLYKLVRSGVARNLAGTIMAYRETFTFPGKGTLYGVFANGVYRLKGTLNVSGAAQVVNWVFDTDPETRGYWLLVGSDGRVNLDIS